MFFDFVLSLLPILYLIAYCIKSVGRHSLPQTSHSMTICFIVIAILAIGLYPADLSIDKPRYVSMYYNSLYYGFSLEFRDFGWIIFNTACASLFKDSIDLFFLLTAVIYVAGFVVLGITQFPKRNLGYFIIMSAGCLGFSNYGTNVIRAGIAMSILMIAFSLRSKTIFKLLLVLIALSLQKSMAIPVIAFFAGKYIKRTRLVLAFWLLCLLLSVTNFDMGPLFESIGFVDERVEQYAKTINSMNTEYKNGFRFDFLIYTIVPLFISVYYYRKKLLVDSSYLQILRMYLFANAVWLLAIRIAYSDRLAYLSWFIIPYLTLYPVIKYQHKFRNPHHIVLSIMAIFMGVRALLLLRTINVG